MKKALLVAAGLLAVALIAVSAYKLYGIYAEYAAGTQLYGAVAEAFVLPREETQPPVSAAPSEEPAHAPIQIDFDALRRANADVVAWLYCEDTVINYPIVQAADNDYYLHRLLDGSYNSAGTLFMDYRNAGDFGDLNTIVYGHNMKNDSMFGTLSEYAGQEYYDSHPVLWLLTPGGDYRVDLLAGFVTPSDSEAYEVFASVEELRAYVDGRVAASGFVAATESAAAERLLTLSTCSYEYNNARYVVIGSLVPLGGDAAP